MLNETIRAIEGSQTMTEAARKLGISRQALWERLERANLRVVRERNLKVVEKSNES